MLWLWLFVGGYSVDVEVFLALEGEGEVPWSGEVGLEELCYLVEVVLESARISKGFSSSEPLFQGGFDCGPLLCCVVYCFMVIEMVFVEKLFLMFI